MRSRLICFTAGGILAAAAICFFLDLRNVAAVLLPVLVHELAHVLALRFLGLRIRGFRAELRGFCIEYSGYCGAVGHAVAAAAGPAAGLAYALAASRLSQLYGSEWWSLSAGYSLLLSVFNMLPALPLDGGRILENLSRAVFGARTGAGITRVTGLTVGILLLMCGMWLMINGGGIALALAAVWLLLAQNKSRGIVKVREML